MMNPNEPQYGQNSFPTPPQPQSAQTQPMIPPTQAQYPQDDPNQPTKTQFDYDFILNPQQSTPKRSFGGNNATKLLVVVGGAAIIIVILLVILVSLLKPKTSTEGLVGIVQRQQEIIRLAEEGVTVANTEEFKGLIFTIDLSVGTNKDQLTQFLSSAGVKIPTKELELKHSASTDKLLESAKTTSTYDSALRDVLTSQLTTYLTELQTTYKITSNKELKTILNNSYLAGKTLLNNTKQSTE